MYNRKDSYYLKAKKEGYLSRAAYKLLEMDKKYKIIRRGDHVLDLGAAPGGWSQAALMLTGPSGSVTAVDLKAVDGVRGENFRFFQGDMMSEEVVALVEGAVPQKYDVIISDMAPHTSGIRLKDHMESAYLVEKVFHLTDRLLKKGGRLLVKLFDGQERANIVNRMRASFKQVKLIRPEATRKESFEMYIVCAGYFGVGSEGSHPR